jgi:transcriptional regulator with XRE-family HTH domain
MLPNSFMNGRSLIAWNLRSLRTNQGYTQDRLALDAGVDRKFIQWLEQQRGNPTLKMLERLAGALSVGLHELFVPPPEGSIPPQPLKCGRKRKSNS